MEVINCTLRDHSSRSPAPLKDCLLFAVTSSFRPSALLSQHKEKQNFYSLGHFSMGYYFFPWSTTLPSSVDSLRTNGRASFEEFSKIASQSTLSSWTICKILCMQYSDECDRNLDISLISRDVCPIQPWLGFHEVESCYVTFYSNRSSSFVSSVLPYATAVKIIRVIESPNLPANFHTLFIMVVCAE